MNGPFLKSPPELIEGIGPSRKAALAAGGIVDLEGLLRTDVGRIKELVPDASVEQIEDWLRATVLLQLDHVDADVAEALVRAGLGWVDRIADVALSTVVQALDDAAAAGKIAEVPSAARIAALHADAVRRRSTGLVVGRIMAEDWSAPVPDAVVRVETRWTRSDEAGWFQLSGVPEGTRKLSINLDGRAPVRFSVPVVAGRLSPFRGFSFGGAATPTGTPRTIREFDGDLIVLTPSVEPRLTTVALDDVPTPTFFLVRHLYQDGRVRLLHHFATQVGVELRVERVVVPGDRLPPGATVGDWLEWDGTDFAPPSRPVAELARERVEAVFPGPVDWSATSRTITS